MRNSTLRSRICLSLVMSLVPVTLLNATEAGEALPLTSNTLYMCEFRSNGSLFKLNPANAAAAVVGALQVSPQCTDLAFRGTTLLGATFTKLMTINPTTGKATLKSQTYGSGITGINALVVQPSTNKVFGAASVAPGKFVEINPNTGRANVVGQFGTGLGSAGDLVFRNGVLYASLTRTGSSGQTFLARVSLSSGTMGRATLVGSIRRVVNGNTVFLRDVWGLEVRNGVMFGAMRTGELLQINPNTAVATLVGDNNKLQAGLARSP